MRHCIKSCVCAPKVKASVSISTAPIQTTFCMQECSIVGHFPRVGPIFAFFSFLLLRDFFPFSFSRFVSLRNLKRKPHDHTDSAGKERERATCGKKDETPHNGQSSLIPRRHSMTFVLFPKTTQKYFQLRILTPFFFNPLFIVNIRVAKCLKKRT